MKIVYEYLKIGNEVFNYLLDYIEDVIFPSENRHFTIIKFNDNTQWFTTEPVTIHIRLVEEKGGENNE
ncbi:MAG: hypothetical protein QW754_05655 [Thermoplasmata archaeon]